VQAPRVWAPQALRVLARQERQPVLQVQALSDWLDDRRSQSEIIYLQP
jgi:hypothetical protein